MTTSLVLDFETFATTPDAIVTEIGCIAVNRSDLVEIDAYQAMPDLIAQFSARRACDSATIEWAKGKGVFRDSLGDIGFAESVNGLLEFIARHNPVRIWTWGKCFERPLLENLAAAVGAELPFMQFRKFACGRDHWQTAFGMGVHPLPRPHHALQDCRAELTDIYQALAALDRVAAF